MRGPRTGLFLIVTAACSGPALEIEPWTIPPTATTRVIEGAPASDEERAANRIELIEDLLIASSGDDGRAAFLGVGTIAVDDRGAIYVVDSGNKRVQVFDGNGAYLRTLGQEGQGPGELMLPTAVAIVGNRVVVNDVLNRRLGLWDLEGNHVDDVRPTGARLLAEVMFPLGTDAFVTSTRSVSAAGPHNVVASYGLDGRERVRFADLPFFEPVVVGDRVGFGMFSPTPAVAADSRGGVYLADAIEYQVHAYDESGEARWALRVGPPSQELTPMIRDRAVDLLRRSHPDLDATGAEWPERMPAIDDLAVDGHDRLFVFPFDWRTQSYGAAGQMDPGVDVRPVDVYSRDGVRILGGSMPNWRWLAPRGDFVYGVRSDEAGEEAIVRYRLLLPDR